MDINNNFHDIETTVTWSDMELLILLMLIYLLFPYKLSFNILVFTHNTMPMDPKHSNNCTILYKTCCISSVIRQSFFSFQNNSKNLDLSCKTYLALWDYLGMVKLVL